MATDLKSADAERQDGGNLRVREAYHTELNGQHLTFAVEAGEIMDEETGTIWRFDGVGISGPLANERLTPVAEAFVAYWFAWPTFYPEIRIWGIPFDAGP